MRVSDDRYTRDRQRLDLALRLIRHEARTFTIRQWTGLSDDRIRKLYRSYCQDCEARPVPPASRQVAAPGGVLLPERRPATFMRRSWRACSSSAGCCAGRPSSSSRATGWGRWNRGRCSARPTRRTVNCIHPRRSRSSTPGSSCWPCRATTNWGCRAATYAAACAFSTCCRGGASPAAIARRCRSSPTLIRPSWRPVKWRPM